MFFVIGLKIAKVTFILIAIILIWVGIMKLRD